MISFIISVILLSVLISYLWKGAEKVKGKINTYGKQINDNANASNYNFEVLDRRLELLDKELALLQHKYQKLLKEEE